MWKGLKKLGESWIVDGVEPTAITDVLDQESRDPRIQRRERRLNSRIAHFQMLQSNDVETISHPRSLTFGTAALPWRRRMQSKIIGTELPSRHFQPRVYGVGAWTDHLHFGYDLLALLQPKLGRRARHRDEHAGGYDETTFIQISAHNRAHYETFSKLLRCSFDAALERFPTGNIDILQLDGLHTEAAVQHDLDSWMPKIRPGGILLLHDVNVRSRDFGVWKIWEELRRSGRSWSSPRLEWVILIADALPAI
jgi:hypothetical protein